MSWFSWFTPQRPPGLERPPVFLTNTLSKQKELFVSIRPGHALLYSCGPTMYGPVHVGNLRAYVFVDTLVRTLREAGYAVHQVINITDFGHLSSDGDEGEDKMTKGLKREKLSITLPHMRELAERYTASFIEELGELGLDTHSIDFPRASDYIPEQIAFIKTLEQKAYTYTTKNGVYFDTSHFPGYGKLADLPQGTSRVSDRIHAGDKKNPADFVLWKPDEKLGWPSPWGQGFPGWHIECSTMSRSLLGPEIDIHTGGEDLIPIHHNNEIAQSEAASGRTFAHYWLHNAFLTMHGEKAAKSLGNVVYLEEVIARGIHPRALRYFFHQAHYRTPLSFSWEALLAAESALTRLWSLSREVARESGRTAAPSECRARLLAAMRDDLSTPQAIGILWESLKSQEYTPKEKWGLLEDAEAHLGLLLTEPPERAQDPLPKEVADLLAERENARGARNYARADELREEIEKRGYRVDDGPQGVVVVPTRL